MALRRADLLGSWRLVSWTTEYPDGRQTFPYGADAQGLLVYAPDWMSATVSAADRPAMAANPRKAEKAIRARAFDSYFHYAGRWWLEGDTVIHEVTLALNPALVGTTQRRDGALDGDQLALSATEPLPDGGGRRHELRWTRSQKRSS